MTVKKDISKIETQAKYKLKNLMKNPLEDKV